MTTFKTGSVLVSGTGAGDTATAFLITFNVTHPTNSNAFVHTDFLNSPVWLINDKNSPFASVLGDYLACAHGLLDAGAMRIDGRHNPAPLIWPDTTSRLGLQMWSGTGAPSHGSTVPANRTVTDMVTNGTTTITSATAAFDAPFDNDLNVTGTNIPANTTIAITNSTTAVLSQAATGSGSGGTLNLCGCRLGDLYIRRDGSGGSRIYQHTALPSTWTAIA